jgi:hypothetical protein
LCFLIAYPFQATQIHGKAECTFSAVLTKNRQFPPTISTQCKRAPITSRSLHCSPGEA